MEDREVELQMSRRQMRKILCATPVYREFELKFILTKEAYLVAFPEEDGSLWEDKHARHLELFHQLYKTRYTKDVLYHDTVVLLLAMFGYGTRDVALFDKKQFSRREYRFLLRAYSCGQRQYYLKYEG